MDPCEASPYSITIRLYKRPSEELVDEILYEVGRLHQMGVTKAAEALGIQDQVTPVLALRTWTGRVIEWPVGHLKPKNILLEEEDLPPPWGGGLLWKPGDPAVPRGK